MNIQLTDRAAKWFQDEMLLHEGDLVRFHVRYGGLSPIQAGFSLGVHKVEPIEIASKHVHNGVTYYIEESDVWYFDGHNLEVDYDNQKDEPIYHYNK